MSGTATKEFLSGSTTGLPIAVAATATPGTTVHATTATPKDLIWLKASNVTATDEVLTLEFGGTGIGNELKFPVPANSTVVILADDILGNSLVIAAYATAANAINLVGSVDRYTP